MSLNNRVLLERQADIHKQLLISKGEITPEIEMSISMLDMDIKAKIGWMAGIIENISNNIDAKTNKIKVAQAKKKSLANNLKWWKDNTILLMDQLNLKKLEIEDYTITIGNSTKLEVTDIDLIPDVYITKVENIEYKVDKMTIKKDLKNKVVDQVNGTKLVINRNLNVK